MRIMAFPNDPAARLRLAAAGRREYARNAPEDQREILLIQAECYESAAYIVSDDIRLQLVIPSWMPMDYTKESTMDDARIKEIAQKNWDTKFQNWSGDGPYEMLIDEIGDTDEGEIKTTAAYNRLMVMLSTAKIQIVWGEQQ